MPKILEVYDRYKIMPILQVHQLRVAAAVKQICDNFTKPVDEALIIKACLLHDMANIMKFDLGVFPEYLQPQGREYWEKVKQEFITKYGNNEHAGSIAIAKELGMGSRIVECIESISFTLAEETAKSTDWERKICDYADLRVGPHGVLSLQQRIDEGNKRYKSRPGYFLRDDDQDRIVKALFENESQIFANSTIKPNEISDRSIAPLIDDLKAYEI